MISFSTSGSFKNTERFLNAMKKNRMFKDLDPLAREGVAALKSATPVRTGVTASSWDYVVTVNSREARIDWVNHHQPNGFPVAISLQYGHGTGSGGYVQGTDYINPAIRPIFDRIADKVWKAVTSA